MAGFVIGARYDWKIKLPEGDIYAEFRGTVQKAFKKYNNMKVKHPGAKLYCNNILVGK